MKQFAEGKLTYAAAGVLIALVAGVVTLAALRVLDAQQAVTVITSIIGLLGGVAAVGLHRQGARIEKQLNGDDDGGEG